jgi:WD40 repeat protein
MHRTKWIGKAHFSCALFLITVLSIPYTVVAIAHSKAPQRISLLACSEDERAQSHFIVKISNDNQYLVSNWSLNSIRMWNIKTGEAVLTFSDPIMESNEIFNISSDTKYIVTGGDKGIAIVWRIAEDKAIPVQKLQTHPYINMLAFSADNASVFVGTYQDVTVWDIQTGNKLRQYSTENEYTESSVLSPNGKYLLTSDQATLAPDEPYRVRLWDAMNGDLLHVFKDAREGMFSPDSQRILTGGVDGYFLWDTQTFEKLLSMGDYLNRPNKFLAFSPDSRYLYGAEGQEAVIIYSADTGSQILRYPVEVPSPTAAFFSDSKKVLIAARKIDEDDRNGGLIYKIVELNTLQEIRTIEVPNYWSSAMNFILSSDDKFVITGIASESIHKWELAETKPTITDFC